MTNVSGPGNSLLNPNGIEKYTTIYDRVEDRLELPSSNTNMSVRLC